MALPPLTRTPTQIRDSFLQTIKNGLYNIGITNANVSRGSDYYVMAEAMATQLGALYNYLLVVGDALMPDTATGEDLDRWLGIVGLSRRPAGGSSGSIVFETDFATLVVVGSELTSATGVRYQVTQGGTYSDGDIIPIESLDTGAETNLDEDEILTWTSAPFGSSTTVNLNVALTGGIDAEEDETARERLLNRLAHAPGAANWQWISDMCEAIDPVVQKAFVYNAANGPSTVHIALAGATTESSKSREIDSIKLNSLLEPTILGNMPEYVETVVTTVEDAETDVSFEMTLPLAVVASSNISGPGTGTGWMDASPWPVANASTHFFCPVTAVTDSTHFTVDSPSGLAPTANITRIMWIDRSDWTIKQATVTSYTGTGPYDIVTSVPFVDIEVGDWIFPACVSAQDYLDAALEAFSLMGPGEKVAVGTFAIAARRPRPQESFPANLDTSLLRYLINAGDEVQTATYYYRSTQTPAVVNDSTANTTVIPSVPSTITDPPKILVPRQLGFYPPYPLQ